MKRNEEQKGITLVALIITIIVLLILAVVAIRAVQGDGIIGHAKNARDNFNQAYIEENGIIQNHVDFIAEQIGDNNENGISIILRDYVSGTSTGDIKVTLGKEKTWTYNNISILEDKIDSILSISRINEDESYHKGEFSWLAYGERYLVF